MDSRCYEDSSYFPEQAERIQELISDYSEIDNESNEFNILKTNSWEIDVDRSISKPAVRLKAHLNTMCKVFVIDHLTAVWRRSYLISTISNGGQEQMERVFGHATNLFLVQGANQERVVLGKTKQMD